MGQFRKKCDLFFLRWSKTAMRYVSTISKFVTETLVEPDNPDEFPPRSGTLHLELEGWRHDHM